MNLEDRAARYADLRDRVRHEVPVVILHLRFRAEPRGARAIVMSPRTANAVMDLLAEEAREISDLARTHS